MHLIVTINYDLVAVLPLSPDQVDCFNVVLGEETLYHKVHDASWKIGLSREDVAGQAPRLAIEVVSDFELHRMLDRGTEIIANQRAEARAEARALVAEAAE
jgi:Uma2 family endonuclease